MAPPHVDMIFDGPVAELYDRHLVPLIFEPYADNLAGHVAAFAPRRVLEVAAGTGVATRALSRTLTDHTELTATDLNQPMLDQAASIGTERPVVWRQADVMELPFGVDEFDVVACQFGVMFFPDRADAYREVARVLAPTGHFVFNTWDRLEANEFADAVTAGVASVFPDDPPQFLPRTPHAYHDESVIREELATAGLQMDAMTTLEARSRAETPEIPAIAYCQGTPLRNEIENRDADLLGAATAAAAAEVKRRFGSGPVDSLIRGFVVTATLAR